jgi:hypothetical protein
MPERCLRLPRVPGRLATLLSAALVAGVLSFVGSVTGPAQATDGRVAAAGTAAATSPSGCWMVASDGGIFAFGDAGFNGSLGDIHLTRPVVGIAPTRTGAGYLLATSEGGVFAFGDAPFAGSAAGTHLTQPIRAILSLR